MSDESDDYRQYLEEKFDGVSGELDRLGSQAQEHESKAVDRHEETKKRLKKLDGKVGQIRRDVDDHTERIETLESVWSRATRASILLLVALAVASLIGGAAAAKSVGWVSKVFLP